MAEGRILIGSGLVVVGTLLGFVRPLAKGGRKPAKKPSPRRRRGGPRRRRQILGRASSNKRAEVIAMMKRAKGATLTEIMAATKWQAHTIRGFVSILGSKGGRRSSPLRAPTANGHTRSRNKSWSL